MSRKRGQRAGGQVRKRSFETQQELVGNAITLHYGEETVMDTKEDIAFLARITGLGQDQVKKALKALNLLALDDTHQKVSRKEALFGARNRCYHESSREVSVPTLSERDFDPRNERQGGKQQRSSGSAGSRDATRSQDLGR